MPRPSGHFGIARSVRLSVPRRSCLGYSHTGCLQLSTDELPGGPPSDGRTLSTFKRWLKQIPSIPVRFRRLVPRLLGLVLWFLVLGKFVYVGLRLSHTATPDGTQTALSCRVWRARTVPNDDGIVKSRSQHMNPPRVWGEMRLSLIHIWRCRRRG